MTSRFASLTEQDIEKIVEDKDSQNTKRSTKVAKELFADYVKEKNLREPEEKKELAQTLKTFYERFVMLFDMLCEIYTFRHLTPKFLKISLSTIVMFSSVRLNYLLLFTFSNSFYSIFHILSMLRSFCQSNYWPLICIFVHVDK